MIISRTPYRISFFGGGTDYPQWYREEGGAVLSTSIDKYCYIRCRALPPFFEQVHRIIWNKIETVDAIDQIEHPVVREGLQYLGYDDHLGLEIDHQGDLPARSGIGSSSSFTVGFINVMTAMQGKILSKHELALKAIELEQNVLKENVGAQDQVAVSYGGLNVIRFSDRDDIDVRPVTMNRERLRKLEDSLLLVFTGKTRIASNIAESIIANLPHRRPTLRRMAQMVDESLDILNGRDSLDDFGALLHEGWSLKRELSTSITNAEVDSIYEEARKHGALGGKLLGAGSSGFMIFYAPTEAQAKLRQSLSQYMLVDFRFEMGGSKIIYFHPNND